MADDLKNIVEAVLLASDAPVGVARIQSLFDESIRPEASRVHEAIDGLVSDYRDRGVELQKIGSGYRFQTREKYADYLRKLYATRPPKLSRALLETLAIIAYRQPVSRGDIEEVRGVAVSSDIMQRLIERGWVKQVGVRDVPGRPALFGTTTEFLSYFNLASLRELPDLAEQRDLMDIAGEMETPLPEEVLAALRTDGGEPGSEEAAPVDESKEDGDPGDIPERPAMGEVAETPEPRDGERAGEEGVAVKLSGE
jgi:segregation and condensation protein B